MNTLYVLHEPETGDYSYLFPGAYKVGFTTQLIQERLDNYRGTHPNASLKRTWTLPDRYTDKDVHAILDRKNIPRIQKGHEVEWFDLGQMWEGIIDDAVRELLGRP